MYINSFHISWTTFLFSFHISYGVLVIDFDGILFKIYAAVSRAYLQNEIGRSVKHIKDHTISHIECSSLAYVIISVQTTICTRPNSFLTLSPCRINEDLGHFTHKIRLTSSIRFKNIQIKELFFVLLVYL